MGNKVATSITITRARNLLKKPERSTIFCNRIQGFYAIRLARGVSFRYRYRDEAGKRRTVTIGQFDPDNFKPSQAAEKAASWAAGDSDPMAEREAAREAAQAASVQAEARKLGKYLSGDYAAHQSDKATGAETIARIRHEFVDILDTDMAKITKQHITEWRRKRENQGIARSTLKRGLGALQTCLNQAVEDDLLESNPIAGVSVPKNANRDEAEAELKERREASRRPLTDDELERIYKGMRLYAEQLRGQRRRSRAHGKPDLPDLDETTFPHWILPLIEVSKHTGLRPGDALSLKWGTEVNLESGRITKMPAKTSHHENPITVMFAIPDNLHRVLKAWHEQQGKPQTGFVFPSPVTGRKMDRQAYRKPWDHIKRLGGLPDDLTFYCFRHNVISRMVESGKPMLQIARIVGHKSASMIEEFYYKHSPEAADTALQSLSESMPSLMVESS